MRHLSVIADLRSRVAAIEGAVRPRAAAPFGVDAIDRQVQREGDVIHVIARRLDDMSPLLASVGGRADVADVYRVSHADVVKHGMGPDPRDPAERPLGKAPRDIYIPDLRLIGSGIVPGEPVEGIKVRTRDFR